MDKNIEQLFTAQKEDNDLLREEMREEFNDIKKTLKVILDIVKTYDVERKEIKSALWKFDRRLKHLEQKPA